MYYKNKEFLHSLLSSVFSAYSMDHISFKTTPRGNTILEFNSYYREESWVPWSNYPLQNVEALSLVNRIMRKVDISRYIEKDMEDLLTEYRGNQSEIARVLDINRGTVRKLITKDPKRCIIITDGVIYKAIGEYNQ